MKDYIEERAIGIANYIIDHNATVRQTAKAFGISKSTVHKDVTERLAQVNPALAKQARGGVGVDIAEGRVRGGRATREKSLRRRWICGGASHSIREGVLKYRVPTYIMDT